MKNVLITGGAGFIGYHLAIKLLSLNYKIYLIDNLSRGKIDYSLKKLLLSKNVKLIKYDLNQKIKLKENFDYIFHLAAVVGVANVNKNPYETIKNNITPLLNFLDFINLKKTKVIFFSTSEVYSPLIKKNKISFPLKVNNDLMIPFKITSRDTYFLSKLFCEKILQTSNCEYIILRPHNIYGPRMGHSHVIPELTTRFKKSKKKIDIFSPNHTRAFCYIDDAINQIIELSLNKKIKNTIFNIGNHKEEIKIYELAKKIQNIMKKKYLIKKGIITEGSPQRRVPDMKHTLSRIKSKNFVKLDDGLLKTISWYINEKN